MITAQTFRLDGRLALVTGSSAGIGLGLARGLAQAGASIVLNGRDATKLKATIPLLRQLTTQAPAEFWPTLETLCANAGVLIIKVPTYPRLRVYGATYRYHGKTIVQLSDTRRTVDQFWFSFFHTIGHLLLHGVKASYLAGDIVAPTDTPPTPQEAEADAFAARTLIPDGAMRRFIREAQATYTSPDIMQFAAQQGIDPAIVVGRLQQVQALPYHTPLNELKGSYGRVGTQPAACVHIPSAMQ